MIASIPSAESTINFTHKRSYFDMPMVLPNI